MKNLDNIFEKITERQEEFFEKLLEGKNIVIKQVGSSYRIEPCIFCGHNDCLTFSEDYPTVNCFSCETAMNYLQLAKHVFGNFIEAVKFIEEFIGEKIVMSKEDEASLRRYQITEKAAEHYHEKLLKDKKYLDYQLNERQHSLNSIKAFKMGKSENYFQLYNSLLEEGFEKEEIKNANVWIPDGLFVFPYFDQNMKIKKFNSKNPFKVTNEKGEVIKGFATGPKEFYNSHNLNNDSIIVCEGEHDLVSLIEAGAVSVVATGGTPSAELIMQLRQFKKVYAMFDTDEAGRRDTQKVNELLPDVAVFEIKYDSNFKDPDEYYKKNTNPLTVGELIKNAVELENNNFTKEVIENELIIKNRKFNLSYKVKEVDKNSNFKGDFNYYNNGIHEDIKFGISVDKINKKYINFIPIISDTLYNFYNEGFDKKDYKELLKIYPLSSKKHEIIKTIADKIAEIKEHNEKQEILNFIETQSSQFITDAVMKEVNNIENSNLDPDVSYPFMPASQAFNLYTNKAYMYFNMSVKDDEGIKIVPSLLTSDKRVLRLDYYKRKSNQHLLLVDGAFQLHEEVPTAIMSTETCSLKSKFVKKFIDRNITNDDLRPIAILKEMEEYFKQIYYTEDEIIYKMLSLFSYSTYFYQLFGVTPYLFLNAEKGSGKSLLSSLLSKLCFCSRYTVGVTEAALFRTISSCGGTMILDEMENLTSRDKTADSLMASILKSGYAKNTGNTLRTNTETKSVEEFSIFGPKIISNIYGLEDVVEDRCIKIPMKKYPSSITNKMMNIKVFENTYRDEIEETSSKACLSALVYFSEIYNKFISTNMEMGSARNSQIMRPLFALATVVGKEYEDAVLEYYLKYMEKDKKLVEAYSPEGCLKEAMTIIAESVKNRTMEWIDVDTLDNYCEYINENEFTVNTFIVKIILDQIDGQKTYSMTEVHKLIKRVYPAIELKNRTSISISKNENWVKVMKNQTKIAVYVFRLKYSDFLIDKNKKQDNNLSTSKNIVDDYLF